MARGTGAIDPKISKKEAWGSKTNFWCRWITHNTKTMFTIFLCLHIGSVLLTGILLFGGYNILPIVFDDLPLEMPEEVMYLRSEAWRNRNDELKSDDTSVASRKKRDVVNMGINDEKLSLHLSLGEDLRSQFFKGIEHLSLGHPPRSEDHSNIHPDWLSRADECCTWNSDLNPLGKRNCWCNPHSFEGEEHTSSESVRRDKRSTIDPEDERRKTLTSLILLYEDASGGNILTTENLRKIAKFEYDLYNNVDFRTKYCKLVKFQKALHCQSFASILRFFDGSYAFDDGDFFDPSFTNIPKVINLASESDRFKDSITYYLSVDSTMSNTTAISRRTRTLVYFGYPLKEYLGEDTDRTMRTTQRLVWRKWAGDNLTPDLLNYNKNGLDGLSFNYVCNTLYWGKVFDSIVFDMCWLIAGFAFIFLFMFFQTGSVWITAFGMGSVLTSFFGANLIYNVVIGYKYFGIFNVLALFIILGIGADDIFIFSDTWKLYSSIKFDSLEERLSVVFKRASITMFFTSLTTMVAFFVSSFSPLLPISAFGTFAGLCIFVNYISVISFFPSSLILYHKYFEKYKCCCCGTRQNKELTHSADDTQSEQNRTPSRSSATSTETIEKTGNLAKDENPVASDRINAAIVKFFRTKFFGFITNKYARVVILSLFVVFMALCAYSVSLIQLDNSQFRIFDPWTPEEQGKDLNTYGFKINNEEPTVDLVLSWGLGPQDISSCSKLEYDPKSPCTGKTRWETIFNLNDDESQLALLNFCKTFRTGLSAADRDALKIAYNVKTLENNVSCFILDMETFFKKEHQRYIYPSGLNFSLPITTQKMQTIMGYHPKVYKNATIGSITKPFDMAVAYWLENGYSNKTIDDDRAKYVRYLGFKKDTDIDFGVTDDSDIKDYKLVYAGVTISLTVPALRASLTEATPLLELWETTLDQKMEKMPPSLQHGFQQAYLWVWINILQNLFTQSFTAFGVGLALAFLVIFLGTQNIITGLFATLMLGCVTCGVLAMIPVAGWKFGLLEGLNFCLIVGLAVDYIVHLAEGYHMASFTSRLDRTRDTLEKVGISVVSGAITTLGSSFFMIFAKIIFFKQFGLFIFATIGLSMIFSLFVMLTTYSAIGPEGYFASFAPLCRNLQRYKEHQNDPGEKGKENKAYAEETM